MLFETDLTRETMTMIYAQILGRALVRYDESVKSMIPELISATLEVYDVVKAKLKPTPRKLQYVFSQRDAQSIFQGVCTGNPKTISSS